MISESDLEEKKLWIRAGTKLYLFTNDWVANASDSIEMREEIAGMADKLAQFKPIEEGEAIPEGTGVVAICDGRVTNLIWHNIDGVQQHRAYDRAEEVQAEREAKEQANVRHQKWLAENITSPDPKDVEVAALEPTGKPSPEGPWTDNDCGAFAPEYS